MAEGVFEFMRSLLGEEEAQSTPRQMIVLMDNCCLISKEYEKDVWVFLKLQYELK
jgi:hypothetical protein